MKRSKRRLKASMILVIAATLLAGCGSAAAPENNVKSVAAITRVVGDGQKIVAVAVEYDKDIVSSALSASTFSVDGRTITRVYANEAAATAPEGIDGRYAVIELSPADKEAYIFNPYPSDRSSGPRNTGASTGGEGEGSRNAQEGPPAGTQGGAQAGAQGSQQGPTQGTRPTFSPISKPTKKVSVTQLAAIATVDGKEIAPKPGAVENDRQINPIVDDFAQLEFTQVQTGKTLKYNLFVPKNFDREKSYPLVVYIHDAGVMSNETDTTLVQGLGAVIWASPQEQAKHECLVLAPQYSGFDGSPGGEGEAGLVDITVDLINSVVDQYNIDKNRIYTTGQSLGCMVSIAMAIKHPDLFTAMFLVAGQWDAQAMSVLADKKMWIIVSEGDTRAFPGMNASLEVMEAAGAKVSRAVWNARAGEAEAAANVQKMIDEGNDIKYAVFEKGTTLPEERAQSGSNEHMSTWKIAYSIEGVRDWLFTQTKQSPEK